MTAKTTLPRETSKSTIGKSDFLLPSISIATYLVFIFDFNRFNAPEKLVQKDVNKTDLPAKESKLSYLQNYLAGMKSGTKVFQHFLANSNISKFFDGLFAT